MKSNKICKKLFGVLTKCKRSGKMDVRGWNAFYLFVGIVGVSVFCFCSPAKCQFKRYCQWRNINAPYSGGLIYYVNTTPVVVEGNCKIVIQKIQVKRKVKRDIIYTFKLRVCCSNRTTHAIAYWDRKKNVWKIWRHAKRVKKCTHKYCRTNICDIVCGVQ